MKPQKSVFRPIALAVSTLLSTGAFAQSIVFTNTSTGQQVLGESYVTIYDYGTRLQSKLTESGLTVVDYNNFTTTGTSVTARGITTNALSANTNATLAISGQVDFTNATVSGLQGMFDPAQVTSPLVGAIGSGATAAASGYSIDLVTGAATLGAVNASSLTTTGNAAVGGNASVTGNTTIGGTLAVTGVSTTNGITNTGNIATTTLNTTGLATLNSAAITNNATVGGTLAVTGATTLNGATAVNNTLNVNGATTVVGTTNINATGTAATSIGNAAAPVTVTGSAVTAVAGNSQVALQNGEARMTVTNAAGNTHGLVVGESSTTLSGGTRSTSLTLNDNGATFGNSTTGAPVRVTGVANGSSDFDAVNVRQFGSAVAGATAAANIPGVDTNKTSSVGVGLGSFMNQQALAFGGSYRFSDNGVLRASVATGLNSGGSKSSVGVGAAWSW